MISEINSLPAGLNTVALSIAESIVKYAEQRTQTTVVLDFEVKDKKSRFTYSEVLSFIELYNSKKTNIDIVRAGLIRVVPSVAPTSVVNDDVVVKLFEPKTFTSSLPGKRLKVSVYKQWLQQELQKFAAVSDNDEIELN